MMRRLVPILILCLTLALVVALILFQNWQTAFDRNLYATMTAIH
jgi:peptidoglycan/LPS O-acetylase OafA/YrhL